MFEAKNLMHQADTAPLIDALKGHVISLSNYVVLKTIPTTEYNVSDIEYNAILHRLKWLEGITYCSIAHVYDAFTVKHYMAMQPFCLMVIGYQTQKIIPIKGVRKIGLQPQ